jgi:Na+-driven multidrug efflux pump
MSVLGLAPADPSSIFLRWVGAFVLSVGLIYLYPWLLSAARRRKRFVVVVEATVVIRAVVAVFVFVAILRGSLESGWWVIALSDASMALVQIGLLRWGVFGEP